MNFACGEHCKFLTIRLRGEAFAREKARLALAPDESAFPRCCAVSLFESEKLATNAKGVSN